MITPRGYVINYYSLISIMVPINSSRQFRNFGYVIVSLFMMINGEKAKNQSLNFLKFKLTNCIHDVN